MSTVAPSGSSGSAGWLAADAYLGPAWRDVPLFSCRSSRGVIGNIWPLFVSPSNVTCPEVCFLPYA
jgi:hypothetical protein